MAGALHHPGKRVGVAGGWTRAAAADRHPPARCRLPFVQTTYIHLVPPATQPLALLHIVYVSVLQNFLYEKSLQNLPIYTLGISAGEACAPSHAAFPGFGPPVLMRGCCCLCAAACPPCAHGRVGACCLAPTSAWHQADQCRVQPVPPQAPPLPPSCQRPSTMPTLVA